MSLADRWLLVRTHPMWSRMAIWRTKCPECGARPAAGYMSGHIALHRIDLHRLLYGRWP